MKYLIYLNLALIVLLTILILTSHSFIASGAVSSEIKASWYGEESCVNKDCLTASGERFDETKISCASRKYYGQTLTIEYQGKTIECRVNDKQSVNYLDRIDLSKKAFETLADLDRGIILVNVVK